MLVSYPDRLKIRTVWKGMRGSAGGMQLRNAILEWLEPRSRPGRWGRCDVKALKKEQEQAFRALLYGSADFIRLPTGYGKSLYFAMLR